MFQPPCALSHLIVYFNAFWCKIFTWFSCFLLFTHLLFYSASILFMFHRIIWRLLRMHCDGLEKWIIEATHEIIYAEFTGDTRANQSSMMMPTQWIDSNSIRLNNKQYGNKCILLSDKQKKIIPGYRPRRITPHFLSISEKTNEQKTGEKIIL